MSATTSIENAKPANPARTLYVMPYSPWSERARWALLHHGIAFEEKAHVPIVGELALRARAKRPFGTTSVPLLVEDGTPYMDSLAIAEHADAIGHGPKLIPAALRPAILELNALAERIAQAGRARVTQAAFEDDAAALELMPPRLRRLPFAAASAKLGAWLVTRKHPTPRQEYETQLREGFLELRQRLGGRPYVHDGFTYADILVATSLQFVSPVDDRYLPIGPATRRRWGHEELAREFAELVAWRDALYAKHRPLAQQRAA